MIPGNPDDPIWLVITPEFTYSEYIDHFIVDQYDICDVIEVHAKNKTEAKALGVKEMLKDLSYTYCRERKADGLSPYGGITVESPYCKHGNYEDYSCCVLPKPDCKRKDENHSS